MHVRRGLSVVVVSSVVWFAVVGRVSVPEAIAGLVASALVTALVAFDAAFAEPDVPVPSRWWRGLIGLPRDVLRDVGVLATDLGRTVASRPSEGGFVTVPVPDRGRAQLVLAILGVTATPNSVVVGHDTEDGTLLIHRLRRTGNPEDDVRARLP